MTQSVTAESGGHQRLLQDPLDALDRLQLLAQLRSDQRLAPVQAVVQRAARLAEKGDLARDVLSAAKVVDPALFEQPSEAAMLAVLDELSAIVTQSGRERYASLCEVLAASASTLAEFFDGDTSVMVMADVEAVRCNRLNLLAVLRNQSAVLADFAAISG